MTNNKRQQEDEGFKPGTIIIERTSYSTDIADRRGRINDSARVLRSDQPWSEDASRVWRDTEMRTVHYIGSSGARKSSILNPNETPLQTIKRWAHSVRHQLGGAATPTGSDYFRMKQVFEDVLKAAQDLEATAYEHGECVFEQEIDAGYGFYAASQKQKAVDENGKPCVNHYLSVYHPRKYGEYENGAFMQGIMQTSPDDVNTAYLALCEMAAEMLERSRNEDRSSGDTDTAQSEFARPRG